jgi:hypothetical protein
VGGVLLAGFESCEMVFSHLKAIFDVGVLEDVGDFSDLQRSEGESHPFCVRVSGASGTPTSQYCAHTALFALTIKNY